MSVTGQGTPLTQPLADAAHRRGNVPTGIEDHVRGASRPKGKPPLWVVDRTLEPQMIGKFISFLSFGHLPGGRKTSLPRPTAREVLRIVRPFSEWALPPHNHSNRSTVDWMGVRIGSYEDGARLMVISKELHSMKTRVWEGLAPLSERRWKDLKLDDPQNFHAACQYLVAVTNVFHYLNHRVVKDNLRKTCNLIWDHLKPYEEAINALRSAASPEGYHQPVSVTSLWYEFISAHYKYISARAHQWVIEHVYRLRAPIAAALDIHKPVAPGAHDAIQWYLTNKIHDLQGNVVHADSTIFMPTDGYKGDPLPAQDNVLLTEQDRRPFREQPITWHANQERRVADYTARLRYVARQEQYKEVAQAGVQNLVSRPMNDPTEITLIIRSELSSQTITRRELRGEPEPLGLGLWLDYLRNNVDSKLLKWSYVAYRLDHEHNDGQWNYFKERFEADSADWGQEYAGIDEIRNISKIHWLDGKELGIEDGNIEAAKKHFMEFVKSENAPRQARQKMFLVADGDVLRSYLKPGRVKEGFILAVDAKFDPLEATPDEQSPGYNGSVRVLGSLLWDDLGAMGLMQNQGLRDLWPLAFNNPSRIYEGPLPRSVMPSGAPVAESVAMAQRYSAPQQVSWIVVACILGNYFFGGSEQ
ncbi:hypothetical protein BGZ61DRAFT_353644 [Ilyonectria robusta]|uniref:uncharacterized protein n=1 Tax=Ilyonectria robusta TaxID=1079257 RepID=UPI001E8E9B8B|nr:uncharacterized protein BGZ61DRAFT_353644 [Ilyonectria robusta]KAH8688438.1 hypothetical protein BGZ61DRAFT_353644 [Ilyonectria robusta]